MTSTATPHRRGAATAWRAWVDSAVIPRAEIARMIPSAGWDLVLPLLVMNIVAGAIPVVFVVATSVVIGRVPPAVTGGVDSAAWDHLVAAFLVAAGAFLLAQVMAPLLAAVNARLRRRIDGRLRAEVMRLIDQTTSIAPMEDQDVLNELGEATRQLDSDWHTPGQALGGFIALVGRYGSLVAFCTLIAWKSSWWAGALMFACVMMFRYGNRGGLRKYSSVWRNNMAESRWRDYLRELSMSDVAAKETRIFDINRWLSGRYESAYWALWGPVAKRRRELYFGPYVVFTSIGFVVTGLVVWSIGHAAVRGEIDLTSLALCLQAVMAAVMLGNAYEEADVPTQYGMRSIEALRHLRTYVNAADDRERAQTLANKTAKAEGVVAAASAVVSTLPSSSLAFHDVSFTYPGTTSKVLDHLTLDIPAGRSTAIVGVNGAGKTTLVKLLTRLYEPTGGAIVADGANIGHLDVIEWRKQVSVIFQDFVRYEFTAADNIAMGANHAPRSLAAIRDAAHQAGILEALEEHPLGLDTPLARAYEGGIDLSGGQWQRIAIARSLYAVSQGAKLLVLDEPTSALDVRAEVAFFDKFVELTQGVTSLLISHRFSSVRRADHIVVIDAGRVSEQGSHSELMALGGHYARLFTLQADRFAKGLTADGEAVDSVLDFDTVDEAGA